MHFCDNHDLDSTCAIKLAIHYISLELTEIFFSL